MTNTSPQYNYKAEVSDDKKTISVVITPTSSVSTAAETFFEGGKFEINGKKNAFRQVIPGADEADYPVFKKTK